MKFKFNQYLLLTLFVVINSLHARVPTLLEIAENEEYRLKIDYKKKTCLFIDESTDLITKKQCFNTVNRLYQITKDQGFLYSISKHYFHGLGIAQDIKKGLNLMEELANSDHELSIDAQAALVIYYGADDAPELIKNSIKEEYWARTAACNGDPLSQYRYASILFKHKGKANEAIYWYKKAAENGSMEAKNKLGELFNEGYLLDKEQIRKFLHEAALEDYQPAFQELYLLYYQEGECEKAKFWYNKFINSEYFKKIQKGIDPDSAIFEISIVKEKKAYREEVNKELEEIEQQSKNTSDNK